MVLSLSELTAKAETVYTGIHNGGPRVSKNGSIVLFPGFFDVHVHFREPGFSYKETIRTGSMAAAHGGYTTVCAMPNLNPVPDSPENLKTEQDIIDRSAVVDVLPYAAITTGEQGRELVDMEALAPLAAAFSDDGRGLQDANLMYRAMLNARALGKVIAAHCEVNSLVKGGCVHDGAYAAAHGLKGICSESEWGEVLRDASLAAQSGCAFHVCHVSSKESVDIIRRAKEAGTDITAETAPHYLTLDDSMLKDSGNFKMNPPVRGPEDRAALLAGVQDGTIDIIATDHAPHSAEEKSRGLEKSPFGIVGLETAFPVLYTRLVQTGLLSLDRLIDLLCVNPHRRFGIPFNPGDFTVFDLETPYVIDPDDFLSMGRSTPFEGWTVNGRCLLTVCDGRIAYKSPSVTLTD